LSKDDDDYYIGHIWNLKLEFIKL